MYSCTDFMPSYGFCDDYNEFIEKCGIHFG